MSSDKSKKRREVWTPHSPKWERTANAMARERSPEIKLCRDCGGPVVDGYVCRWCESQNP